MAEGPGFAQPRGWREASRPAAQALTCHGRTATKTSFKYCTVTQQGFQPTLHSQHVHVNSSWGEQVYLWHLSVPGAGIQTNISYNLETAAEPQIALKCAEGAEQPLPGQDSLHIKSLASPPAFLVSLVLNKRWFLAQADLQEHPSSPLPGWTALHRAPPYRVQKQQSIFPSCRLFNLPKLINLVLFHLLPVNKKGEKKTPPPFQLRDSTFKEPPSSWTACRQGMGLISTPKCLSNIRTAVTCNRAVLHRKNNSGLLLGLLQNPHHLRPNANWEDADVKRFVPSFSAKLHRPPRGSFISGPAIQSPHWKVFSRASILLHWRQCMQSRASLNYRKSTQS